MPRSALTWSSAHAIAGGSDADADTLNNIEHTCAVNFPVVKGVGGAQPSIICVVKNEDNLLFVKTNHTFFRSESLRICCPIDSVCKQEEFDRKHGYRGYNAVCYSPL
jgi:hypothetical protein